MIGWHPALMENREYEWSPHPPTMRQRIIAAMFVMALVVTSVSSYAEWRLFGDYDKFVTAGITIIGLVLFTRFMPTARRR